MVRSRPARAVAAAALAAAAATTAAQALPLSASPPLALDGVAAREFEPFQLGGLYERFISQGDCPATIEHTSVTNPGEGVYNVPYKSITMGGDACTSAGSQIVLRNSDARLTGRLARLLGENDILRDVYDQLVAADAGFLVGFETVDRVCGVSSFSPPTVTFYISEDIGVNVPRVAFLRPANRPYMVVFPKGATDDIPCTYSAAMPTAVVTPVAAAPVEGGAAIEGAEAYGANDGDDATVPPAEVVVVQPDVAGDGSADNDSDDDGDDVAVAAPVDSVAAPEAQESASPTDDSSDDEAVEGPPVDTEYGSDGMPSPTDSEAEETNDSGDEVVDAEGTRNGGLDEPVTKGADGTEPEPSDEDSVCFPASAEVELESGALVTMDKLAVGDSVRVSAYSFSRVFLFTHKVAAGSFNFVKLSTASAASLTLTPGHYVYANGKMTAARAVTLGDKLELVAEAKCAIVTSVKAVTETGLYNPQTLQGDIVVNGIRASTYTTAVQPVVASALLAPLRALFRATGISTSALDAGSDRLARLLPAGASTY